MRILAVGTCLASLDALTMELAAAGHDLLVTRTTRKAFALGPRFQPEVVVSDLFPVGADGYSWWRRLRTDPALRETRFLAVTDRYDAATVRVAREAGYEYVLAKPVDLCALDEYLVGASSPRWRRFGEGVHPWPQCNGGVQLTPSALESVPDREGLADFLCAMRDRAASEPSSPRRLLGSREIPPEELLRHLDALQVALHAARQGDLQQGLDLLCRELAAARSAPSEPWSGALCERYELALTTYCALMDVKRPKQQ
jgi:CheY-like chemotaxis protein